MSVIRIALGLDVGTQSTKCIAFDLNLNQIVGRGSQSYGLISERPAQAEQHPSIWIDACKVAIKQALQGHSSDGVVAIGVSGQQHGLVVLDAQGKIIRPCKLWCDLESAVEAEELSKLYGEALVPSFTATKLLWLKRHEPENFEKISTILLPHDYINYWLTGVRAMEASDASGTGLFDPTLRQWKTDRFAAIDTRLSDWLPSQILSPDQSIGTVLPQVAEELGLPAAVKVAVGGGDNALSALGTGAVEEGTWVVSLGTSGTLFGCASRPIIDPSGTICPFCDATGQALPLLCTVNCTEVTEEVRKLCGELPHDTLAELAHVVPPGSQGVTFLPYMRGERTPNWPHARGTVLGLQHGLMKPGILYRAAMEGATFSILSGLHMLKEQYGVKATELVLVGGGSKSRLWSQIVADAAQLPVKVFHETDAAGLGAALQAGAVANGIRVKDFVMAVYSHESFSEAMSILQPNTEVANQYAEAFRRFTDVGNSLFGKNGVFSSKC